MPRDAIAASESGLVDVVGLRLLRSVTIADVDVFTASPGNTVYRLQLFAKALCEHVLWPGKPQQGHEL